MHELTTLQFLYVLELTAPVFYRVKAKHIKDEAVKDSFHHFEQAELPHSPEIKEFLKQYGKGVFPWPRLIESIAAAFSHVVALFGIKAIYFFEYLFEAEAVHVYRKMANNTRDPMVKKLALKLLDEEIPHLEFFKEKLGKGESRNKAA